MAFKSQADKGRIRQFTIAGTETIVRPIRTISREEGFKYDLITALNMETQEMPFVDSDGRPIPFKTLSRQGKIIGS